MNQEQRITFYKEYMNLLLTDPASIPVWFYLQYKFMLPASMIARNDEVEQFVKQYSLNGIKPMCFR